MQIEVELYEDLVDSCIPGNVVTISGIVKSINSEIHGGRYGKRAQANSLYILYISANSVENSVKVRSYCIFLLFEKFHAKSNIGCFLRQAGKDKDKASDIDFSKEDLEQISDIINQGDVFDRLVHSLCPGIYRNDIVKAGLILALLGGTRNSDEKEATCVTRADSHVLVVGDPGLGKSQMLRAVAMVAPRSVYVGGNTTTTTGLTVTMVKESSGDYALEAGALVLADQGVCCIDEFDKMGIDYQALLEAMEQQSISIAKAGVVCNLNARTSVIAAANPSGGHYNRNRSVGENLKMKSALLSRFDLVFILLDRPDEERDRLLSEHVMNSHAQGKRKSRKRMRDTRDSAGSWSSSYVDRAAAGGYDRASESNPRLLSHRLQQNADQYTMRPIPIYFVRKFIAYARRYVHPRLSIEAASLLQKKYLELRSAGESQANPSDSIPITTRQLESMIRLSQARARAELAELVTAEHAQDVVDIMQECLLDTFITEDGNLDFGRSGGMSLAKKVKAYVARLMKAAARRNTSMFSMEELLEVANSMGLQVDDFRDFVDILRNECYLLKKGPGQFKVQVSAYSNMM
ncbi:hypothetical protein BBJ28_00014506 [Nothophytophthora sp. Chile5]|nr:hypothetical protein BBJ28_00014506 [Nothophytophthora sp. Chile5]